MAETIAEQSLTLRDRFLGPESDEGGARFRAMAAGIGLTACALVGLATSMGGYARDHSIAQATTTVKGGHGEITRVGVLDFPETYYGVMNNKVSGITAKYDNKLFGMSVKNDAFVRLTDGNYTTKIGNGPLKVDYSLNENDKKLVIKFPQNELLAMVYQTDPMDSGMENDNGAVMSIRGAGEGFLNVIPGQNSQKINNIYKRLSGTVLLDAYMITAKKCAPVAWEYLAPQYFNDLKTETLAQVNAVRPKDPLTIDQVEVIPTGDPEFTSQYDKQFKDYVSHTEANGDKFVVEDPTSDKDVTCDVSETVIKESNNTAMGSK